jgi:proteasome lid subunit RPN8/RPN11
MIVRMHRGQLAYFRRKARKHYPNEILALLIGKQIHKGLVEVYRFAYPRLELSTPQEVKTDEDSHQEIYEETKEENLLVVGDIHTHPDYPPVMSNSDHKCHKDNENRISAILQVPVSGQTHLAIWREGTPLPCKIKYFDKE